jgi:hypothetical protein
MTINITPLDTTPNTPLDAIKGAYLWSRDRLRDSLDGLVGARNMPEDSIEVALIDSAVHALALLVCEQLGYDRPSRSWVPTRDQHADLFRYDAGTPVCYTVAVAPGVSMDIWPRFNTRDDVEAILGYSLELAWPTPEQAAQRAVDEAFADTVRTIQHGAHDVEGDQRP